MQVVAGEDLVRADRPSSVPARGTVAAGDDCRDDNVSPHPLLGTVTGRDHRTRDLVAEHQGEWVPGRHSVVEVAQIRVADAAARDFYENLTGLWHHLITRPTKRLAYGLCNPAFDSQGETPPERSSVNNGK